MSTTTIRLDEDLKARIAASAERTGKTPQAFILEAIAQTVEQAERDHAFHKLAESRWQTIVDTGKTVSLAAAGQYLRNKVQGKAVRKPKARTLKP